MTKLIENYLSKAVHIQTMEGNMYGVIAEINENWIKLTGFPPYSKEGYECLVNAEYITSIEILKEKKKK